MAFLFVLDLVILAAIAYVSWQVYLLREQLDGVETKLLRLRLSKNKGVRHANVDEVMCNVESSGGMR